MYVAAVGCWSLLRRPCSAAERSGRSGQGVWHGTDRSHALDCALKCCAVSSGAHPDVLALPEGPGAAAARCPGPRQARAHRLQRNAAVRTGIRPLATHATATSDCKTAGLRVHREVQLLKEENERLRAELNTVRRAAPLPPPLSAGPPGGSPFGGGGGSTRVPPPGPPPPLSRAPSDVQGGGSPFAQFVSSFQRGNASAGSNSGASAGAAAFPARVATVDGYGPMHA
jgi:hypothetical protein